MAQTKLDWQPRQYPLEPMAVLCKQRQFKPMVKRLLGWSATKQNALQGLHFKQTLMVLIGKAETLPWLPGCIYFGKDHLAPNLMMPTLLTPTISADIVQFSVTQKLGSGLYLIDPTEQQILPLHQARQIQAAYLESLLT
ncbi:hypothetical protein [Zooshikella sp. RANM57]|uniref:bpX5 domain-containing protein n=1 Tax=Zooshikella sp. RANM57 TaxID=3425863 RepID=UPI003D6FE660